MSSGRSTRDARQEKAAQMRAAAARVEARRRTLVVTSIVLVLVIAVVVGFVLVQNARHDSTTKNAAAPANVAANDSIVVGQTTAPVTIISYEDFQCPFCAQYEAANRDQLAAWVKAGTVQIHYRPIAFLDRSSTTQYSTRALNAAAGVINSDPSAFQKFHDLLFENQPAERSAGLTDDQLVAYAVQAGASKATISTTVKDQTYKGWTAKVTEDSSKAGIASTPTVIVNGTTLKALDAATVKSAVDTAAAAAKK